MNSDRIAQLKSLIQAEPNDPFYTYALALEHLHADKQEALALLQSLVTSHPHYLPTYYQTGLLHVQLGNIREGEQVLEKGIELAKKINDVKTLNELRSLLDSL